MRALDNERRDAEVAGEARPRQPSRPVNSEYHTPHPTGQALPTKSGLRIY